MIIRFYGILQKNTLGTQKDLNVLDTQPEHLVGCLKMMMAFSKTKKQVVHLGVEQIQKLERFMSQEQLMKIALQGFILL